MQAAKRGDVLLALDAAPGVGSVAIVRGSDILVSSAVAMRPATAGADRGAAARDDDDPLMVAVAATLREASIRPADLSGIACGAGPGGFTSLRIAAALAKGIAHAVSRPLLVAPSLGWAAAVRASEAGVWLVTLDALRGERYVARVNLAARARTRPDSRAVLSYHYLGVHAAERVDQLVGAEHAIGRIDVDGDVTAAPIACGSVALPPTPVDLASWEPVYGRLAEAQARWEAEHGPLVVPPGEVAA